MRSEPGHLDRGSPRPSGTGLPVWLRLLPIGVVVLVSGVVAATGHVTRPVWSHDWRESDVASIARNFDREGMNPLYPRVDWRGTGPGYAEMELPVLSWSMAVLERSFGAGVPGGRILVLLVTLVSVAVFFKLAVEVQRPVGAAAATLLFAFHPLIFRLSTTLKPEPLMLLGYLAGIWWFRTWLRSDSTRDLVLAMAAASFAILAKAPAAHILVLFALWTIHARGFKKLFDRRFMLLGLLALIPPLAWYVHAHGLWLAYGNSLGVSNEAHALSLEVLLNPSFLMGIPSIEAKYVWLPLGTILLVVGLTTLRPLRSASTELLWFVAIGIYYLAAAKSAAHEALYYYHVVAVPPTCLLIGRFLESAAPAVRRRGLVPRLSIVMGMLTAMAVATLFELETFEVLAAALVGGIVIGICLALASRGESLPEIPPSTVRLVAGGVATGAVVALYAGVLVASLRYDKFAITGARQPSPLYLCAQDFAAEIPEQSLILASGGVCRHREGGPAAHNAPYMFYWLDRKGFNLCAEDQSVQAVRGFARQGADYFVAEYRWMDRMPGFKDEADAELDVVAECEGATLYRLNPETTR